jgi:uncharacterized protein (DUF302 family)
MFRKKGSKHLTDAKLAGPGYRAQSYDPFSVYEPALILKRAHVALFPTKILVIFIVMHPNVAKPTLEKPYTMDILLPDLG